jgi:putative two-component system response regulator
MKQLLLVDDDDALRAWETRVMRGRGYSCDSAGDASEARVALGEDGYELVLLDVNMPGESGLQLLSHIRVCHPDTAVMMVTGEDSTELALTAIEHGAYGYLVKPVGAGELTINVVNALRRRHLEIEHRRAITRMQHVAEDLEGQLEQALQDLHISEGQVTASRAETIFRLARLVEIRDADTGEHIHRMSEICAIIARRLGMSSDEVETIRLASQLHDVGKVAIPDSILLKPGKLTQEEFEVVKGHAQAGHEMLSDSASELVQLGASIALTHHEHFDGAGYPHGLPGEQIPLEGRIAAIADVFDALTTDRVYRSAMPVASALEIMQSQRGKHFDPRLLDLFVTALPEVEEVRFAYAT